MSKAQEITPSIESKSYKANSGGAVIEFMTWSWSLLASPTPTGQEDEHPKQRVMCDFNPVSFTPFLTSPNVAPPDKPNAIKEGKEDEWEAYNIIFQKKKKVVTWSIY